LIVLERTPLTKDRKSSLFHKSLKLSFLLPLFFVLIASLSSVLFRSQNIDDAWVVVQRILSFIPSTQISQLINKYFLIFTALMLTCGGGGRRKDFPLSQLEKHIRRPLRWIIYYIFIFIIFQYAGFQEDFIYFQF
jgi:hypothetical protein